MQNTDRVWLVKSSTRVLGPFTFSQVCDFLTKRNVSIIDEVKSPHSRWTFLREHPQFQEIIKSVRQEQDNSKDETVTTAHSTQTKTGGINDDLTPTPTPTFTATPVLNQSHASSPSIPSVTPVISSKETAGKKEARVSSHTKAYGSDQDGRVKEKMDASVRRTRWAILLTTFLMGLGFIFYKQTHEQNANLNGDQYFKQALRQKSVGLMDLAVESYKKGLASTSADHETQMQMLPVLMVQEGQTVELRKEFENIVANKSATKGDLAEAYNFLGLSYFMDRENELAGKNFQLALSAEPGYLPSLYNQAVLALNKKSKIDFDNSISRLSKSSDTQLMVLLLKARYIISENRIMQDPVAQSILDSLHALVGQTSQYRREISFLSYLFAKAKSNSAMMSYFASLFFESAHRPAKDFLKDIRFDNSIFDWDWMAPSCIELERSPVLSDRLVFAVCAHLISKQNAGAKVINEVLAAGNKDRDVKLAYAQTLYLNSQYSESLLALRTLNLPEDTPINLMMGEICLKLKDYACAQDQFMKVNLKSPQDIFALTGLGEVSLRTKQYKLAQDYVAQALLLDPGHLPAIAIRDQLEARR